MSCPAAFRSHSVGLNPLRKNRRNSPFSTWWHLGMKVFVIPKATRFRTCFESNSCLICKRSIKRRGSSFWTSHLLWLQEAKSISVAYEGRFLRDHLPSPSISRLQVQFRAPITARSSIPHHFDLQIDRDSRRISRCRRKISRRKTSRMLDSFGA